MVVNIRQDATDINIVRSAMPLFGRSIILGVEALTESVARSLDISFDQAMELLPDIPVFNITPTDSRMGQAGQVARTIFSDIGDEVMRSFEFYKSQVGDVKIDQVILTGPGCMLPNVHEYFTSKLRLKTVLGDPFRDMLVEERVVSERMRPILAALIGSSIEPTWNPSITVDMDLNKEGRVKPTADEHRTQNIVEELGVEYIPSWYRPGLVAAVLSTLLVFGAYIYLTAVDIPMTKANTDKAAADIISAKKDLTTMKTLRQQNEVLSKRKALLASLVGGVKHLSNYMEVVRDNTPKGVQLCEISLGDEEMKIDGAAVNFSTVGNLSINLGGSPLVSQSSIEFASRADKRPDLVAFSLKAKIAKATASSGTTTAPPQSPINRQNTIGQAPDLIKRGGLTR